MGILYITISKRFQVEVITHSSTTLRVTESTLRVNESKLRVTEATLRATGGYLAKTIKNVVTS